MGLRQLLLRPPRRVRRWLLLPGMVALLVVPALVWQSSYAGFTDSTAPLSATVRAGTIKLTNTIAIGGAVRLNEVLPGQTYAYCIRVTSAGTAPAEVRLYGAGKAVTKSLDAHIKLSWVAGTGGGGYYGECTGFTPSGPTSDSTLSTFPTSWATGVLPWPLTGNAGENRTYRLTYTVDPAAPVTTKGGTVTATFVWEAQTR
jgi:hypothetical protein